MAGRASIVGAAETSVGKVRDHNEDSHFIDPEQGIFLVCDGMGGHAAGEVASALAVQTIRELWGSNATQDVAERWLARGTPEARKALLQTITQGVVAAHDAILAETEIDKTKSGMGTTLVGAMVVGGDIVFAHCGDSRAYLVRDGIAMQLTEDHTLLARLLAAGVDVDTQGEGSRFKSMLTNALGIGTECKVSTFVVPVADGDRFLLCSDGITEYVQENEIGLVLTKQPSPARSAQRLVEMALERGGGDNATALVVRVLEAGETARPSELLKKENDAINSCTLWAKVTPQQRLRALRISLPRDHAKGEKVPAQTLGDKVAWIIVEGTADENGEERGPGTLLYPEALLNDRPVPDKDGLAVATTDLRAIAFRSDDFHELCEEDADLAEALLEALALEIAKRKPRRVSGSDPNRTPTVPLEPLLRKHAEDIGRANTEQMSPLRKPTDPADPARASTDPGMPSISIAPVENKTIEMRVGKDASPPALPSLKAPISPTAATPPTGVPRLAAEEARKVDAKAEPPKTEPPKSQKPVVDGEADTPKSTQSAPAEPPVVKRPTTPPPAAVTLPKVQSAPHPKVAPLPRTPTPAGGVLLKTPTPPAGVRPITPPAGVPRAITPPAGVQPILTPPNLPRLTPPTGVKAVTQGGFPRAPTPPPIAPIPEPTASRLSELKLPEPPKLAPKPPEPKPAEAKPSVAAPTESKSAKVEPKPEPKPEPPKPEPPKPEPEKIEPSSLFATKQPQGDAPRTKRDTSPRFSPRGTAPPAERSLIVPAAERAATDAAVETSFANLTVDDGWDSGPFKKVPTIPPPLATAKPEPAPAPPEPEDEPAAEIVVEADDEPVAEIVVEADEPPESAAAKPATVQRAASAQSDPEISIEALEGASQSANDDDDEAVIEVVADAPSERLGVPFDDSSQPEIEIITSGRAITSNEMPAVSGGFDVEVKGPPKRKK